MLFGLRSGPLIGPAGHALQDFERLFVAGEMIHIDIPAMICESYRTEPRLASAGPGGRKIR